MAKPSQICVVAQDAHDGIVGFASGGPERTGDPNYRGELYACYLLQPHQRRGAGTSLFLEIAAQLEQAGFNSMLAWVLVQNSACRFYEKLGGKRLREQPIKIGNIEFPEVAYGWPDLRGLRTKSSGPHFLAVAPVCNPWFAVRREHRSYSTDTINFVGSALADVDGQGARSRPLKRTLRKASII